MDRHDLNPAIKSFSRFYVNYLVATGKSVGLILNFGERKVEIKRKIKDLKQEINGMKENYHVPAVSGIYPV